VVGDAYALAQDLHARDVRAREALERATAEHEVDREVGTFIDSLGG